MAFERVRVASIGIGWWSDVLADAMARSALFEIVACYSRSEAKRQRFAARYGCAAATSYAALLDDERIEAIVNTTPNGEHLETTCRAAGAGKHVFLDKPIANTIADARRITQACAEAGVVLAIGHQRRREAAFRWMRERIDEGRFGRLVNAEANISRDRLGRIDLGSWRYSAAGMPGGVMLQIGIHYVDVLERLLGPVKSVSGALAQLALPGENPDVASLVLEHESGALATLNASYASAAEHYVLNLYGKEASAYFDGERGLRWRERGASTSLPVALEKNDPLVEQLDEFALAVRGGPTPEVGGASAAGSLAVVLAGIRSAREGRRVAVAEVLGEGDEGAVR